MGLSGIDREFWCGRRVLLTGHTGFKGSWLALWLLELGAEVFGMALEPEPVAAPAQPLFTALGLADRLGARNSGDLRQPEAVQAAWMRRNRRWCCIWRPTVGAPCCSDPLGTWSTNVQGGSCWRYYGRCAIPAAWC